MSPGQEGITAQCAMDFDGTIYNDFADIVLRHGALDFLYTLAPLRLRVFAF
jgi:hypothetical protein